MIRLSLPLLTAFVILLVAFSAGFVLGALARAGSHRDHRD